MALPFDPDQEWGAKARHHIRGAVDGFMVRGPLARDGERWVLSLGPAWLRDHAVGDEVEVELAAEGPQFDALPPDFAEALAAAPEAEAFFEGLATFYRKGWLTWLAGAKKPEPRAQRIAEIVAALREGRKARK